MATLVILVLVLTWFRPDVAFWLSLLLFLDTGGYFEGYLDSSFQGAIKPEDVFFYLGMFTVFSPKVQLSIVIRDSEFSRFLSLMLLIVLYYIVVYGLITSGHDLSSFFRYFLVKRRLDIYGFLIVIPVYIFVLRGIRVFFMSVIIPSIFFPLFFLITVLTNLELIPIQEFIRYVGGGPVRLSMYSTGLMPLSIYFGMVAIYFRMPWKKNRWLFAASLLMVVISLMTLTKSTIGHLVFQLFIIFFISHSLFKANTFYFLRSILLGLILLLIILFAVKPDLIFSILRLLEDVILIVTEGRDSSGASFSRLDLEIPNQIRMFNDSPLFGTGHTDYWYTKEGDYLGYGASDTPYVAAFAMYGVLGVLVWLTLYGFMLFSVFRILYVLRKSRYAFMKFSTEYPIHFIVLITMISQIIHSILLQPNLLFVHFVRFNYLVYLLLFYGVLLAVYRFFKLHFSSSTEM